MIEMYLRSHVQPLLNELGCILSFFKIQPNQITIAAFICGTISGGLIALGHPIIALLFLLISGICDVLDGTVARKTNQSNPFGAYLDLVSDRMVEALFILGCMVAYPQFYISYVTFFTAVMLHFSTFVVAGALFPNMGKKSMHYDASIVERAEAFIVFSLVLLFPDWINYLLIPFNCLVGIAGVIRFVRVAEYAKTLEKQTNNVDLSQDSLSTASQSTVQVYQQAD